MENRDDQTNRRGQSQENQGDAVGRQIRLAPHRPTGDDPLSPAAVRDNDRFVQTIGQTSGHRHGGRLVQRIVEHQVGTSLGVARQAIRRLAVNRNVKRPPKIAPPHSQVEARAVKGDDKTNIANRGVRASRDVGPGGGHAPVTGVARRGMSRAIATRPSHGPRCGQRTDSIVHRAGPTTLIQQREANEGIVGWNVGLQVREQHQAKPGPLAARPFDSSDSVSELDAFGVSAPGRGTALPALRQCVPAKGHRPERLVGLPVGHHHPT